MSISCDCSCEDYDSLPTISREEFPVARKVYKCCECGEDIQPGQKYHMVTGLWEDGWNTYRTCMVCYRIRERYCPYGYFFEALVETLSECLGFDYRQVPEGGEGAGK